MIKNLKQIGCHFAKPVLLEGKFRTIQAIDFEAATEMTDEHIVSMNIVVNYNLTDKITGRTVLKAVCSTTFEFEVVEEIKASELIPVWKSAVKNLRDNGNETNRPILKDIPYPPNDMIKESVNEFLKIWGSPEPDGE